MSRRHSTGGSNHGASSLRMILRSLGRKKANSWDKHMQYGRNDTGKKNLNAEEERRERRRQKIIKEIFDTERTYQHHLQCILNCYVRPLQTACLMPLNSLNTIFGNVEQLAAVNKELLNHMETLGIGIAFLKLAPYLKLYSMYANNYEQASSSLQEWTKKSSDFSAFKRLQEEKEENKGLKLEALLITPVQRIPRDCVQKYYSYKWKYSLQFLVNSAEAANRVSDVASSINEHVRQHENFQKMLSIQNSLTGDGAPKILAPGRRFIREGILLKVSKKSSKTNERMLFLFNDMLICAKSNLLENSECNKTYNCRCILPLLKSELQIVLGESQTSSGILFKVAGPDKCLLLFEPNQGVGMQWINEIQNAITSMKRDRASLRKESSARRNSRTPRRRKLLASRRPLGKRSDFEVDPLTSTSDVINQCSIENDKFDVPTELETSLNDSMTQSPSFHE
uniref:Myosin-M heavy chain-like n=1 Tax=Saccoglossus kowalevskii TaxID=10224 RepID=A0ABM0M9V3_SACKO|nr:PREDICTED: myosin-M heavy chain-like [Saccoglossus kowalevskii]